MSATLSSLPAVMANFLPSHSVEEVSPAASSDASNSRSASPVASESSSTSTRSDALSVWPRTWSTITLEGLTPSSLSALFDTEAVDGILGVVRCGADEVAEVLSADLASKELPPYISTTPTEAAIQSIISAAGLRSIISFPSPSGKQSFHLLERPRVAFAPVAYTPGFPAEGGVLEVPKDARASSKNELSLSSNEGSSSSSSTPCGLASPTPLGNIPTEAEWESLWAAWDLVTLSMIPPAMLHQKPIDLRHKCLFYIGHIPTFLDMLVDKAERMAEGVVDGLNNMASKPRPSEPAYFWNVFERGIDPHVDDPDHCHNHSEVPTRDEDWPTLETIIAFRDRVRARLMRLYADLRAGRVKLSRNIARTLAYTLEHEGFHVETLLYMLIQRAGTGTLPPLGFTPPPWDLLKVQWDATPAPETPTATLGPATITLGHDDSEGEDFDTEGKVFNLGNDSKHDYAEEDIVNHEFGWDNESPARAVQVGAFRAEWRPVTNGEFEAYWRKSDGKVPMPKSWVEEDGEVKVRTMYGPVAFDIARHWPVLTAYDDLAAYAASKGGRLPTEPELRLFLDMYDVGHAGGANVGFRNWHPVPATAGLELGANTTFATNTNTTITSATNTNTSPSPTTSPPPGAGSNGGVWEWTSTLFDTHPGLTPTQLFPGYSTDFFDTKHQVVLGASYATIPRLGRRTVRNFYQHNYPYPWVAGRVVYDV